MGLSRCYTLVMELVDTHAHLDFTDDAKGWLARAKEAGVGKIICVGTSIEGSKKSVEITEKYSARDLMIWATVGVHPQDGNGDVREFGSLEGCIDELRKLVKLTSKVVAVGECGLDIRRTVDPSTSSGQAMRVTTDREKRFQGELFEAQVQLAADLKLPLIIHCRNAWEEIFEILSGGKFSTRFARSNNKPRGVFHSWTGDFVAAKKALDLGFYISFSGIVTFKNAPNVQEVAKKIPLSRMLVETDSPFLSPHPYRGMKNEPKNVRIVGKFLAALRGESFDKIAQITSNNATRLFGI